MGRWPFEKTGLPTKPLYRARCQIHRFAKFTEWTRHYAPKLIIGTGLSHDKDFVMAFDGVSRLFKSVAVMKTETVSNKSLKWLPISDGKTILAIMPFPGGWHGLSSDMQLAAFGAEDRADPYPGVREILDVDGTLMSPFHHFRS